jgi:hypothetical protein
MQWKQIRKRIERSRLLQSAALERCIHAEELCRISQDVIYRTADCREFLEESLLKSKSRYDARYDASPSIADLA